MKYVIYNRYEYTGKSGKQFSSWFRRGKDYDTKAEADKALKELKNFCKPIDKKTKHTREFEIRYVDEEMYAQRKFIRPKGRPKKISTDILDNIAKKLIKTKKDRIEIDTEIGVYLYNDENYKKYITDKFIEKNPDKQIRWWYKDIIGQENILYAIIKPKDLEILYY